MKNGFENNVFNYVTKHVGFMEVMVALMISSGILILDFSPCVMIRQSLADNNMVNPYYLVFAWIFLFSITIIIEKIVITVIYVLFNYIIKPLLLNLVQNLYRHRILSECFDGKHESEKNVLLDIYNGENLESKIPFTFLHKSTLLELANKDIISNHTSYPQINEWARKAIGRKIKKANKRDLFYT